METKDAGISLILVTHNREAELARTLETLSCLTCPCPWEVIVIDNASDGDMTQVCEASGLEDLRFFRLEVNLGPPGGRNFGAAQARYEYLVFLDDDANFIEENALARIRDRMNREPDFAIFAFQMRNLEGGLYNWPHGKHRLNRKDGTFSTKYFVGGGCAIRASWFAEIGGFSSELFFWGEETDLVLKSLALGGEGVFYDGSVTVLHRVHGNGRVRTESRFCYQVRNRMYILKARLPIGIGFCYRLCYGLKYLGGAMLLGWLGTYRWGLRDYFQMSPRQTGCRLTLSQLRKWQRLSR